MMFLKRGLKILLVTLSPVFMVQAQELKDLPSAAKEAELSGEYSHAIRHYNEMFNIYPTSGLALKLADLFVLTGQYDRALQILNDTDFDNKELPVKEIHKASVLFRKGEPDVALKVLGNVLADADLEPALKGTALQNRGYIEASLKRYDAALISLTEALPYIKSPQELYNAGANMALALAFKGDTGEALNLIDEVISDYKKSDTVNVSDLNEAYRKKAEIELLAGNKSQSYEDFEKYLQLEKDYIIKEFPHLTPQQRLNVWKAAKGRFSEIFTIGETDPLRTFDAALLRRNITLLNNDLSRLAGALNTDHKDIRKRLGKGKAAVEFVTFRDFLSGDTVYAACILTKNSGYFVRLFTKDELYNRKIGKKTLIDHLKDSSRESINKIYNDKALSSMIWTPITECLDNGTESIYFAPDGVLNVLGIENIAGEATGRYNLFRVSSTARLLDDTTFSGLTESFIIGGLDYNSTDSVTPHFTVTPNTEGRDAFYRKGVDRIWFKYLKWTRIEADSISDLLNLRTVSSMFEPQFMETLRKAGHVHIATHGYYFPSVKEPYSIFTDGNAEIADNTLNDSGLVLSGANAVSFSDYDNLVTAKELSEEGLENLNLIVLSACQTALGDIDEEGCSGILRGLKKAGAKTIMATLWEVDDEATSTFMRLFYSMLRDKENIHDAYFSTISAFRMQKENKKTKMVFDPAVLSSKRVETELKYFDEPYFWAPFILIDAF